jgi:hypothetical protein
MGRIPDHDYVSSAGYLYDCLSDCQFLNMCVLSLSDTFLYLCPASSLTEEENPQEDEQGEDTGTSIHTPVLNPPDDVSDGDGAPDEEESPEEKEEEKESDKDEITSIADSMSNMRVATSRYDLSGRFLFVLYVYAESRHKVSVDLMVFGLPKKCFRPRVRTGGMYLDIEVELPNLFFNWRRLILASRDRERRLLSQNDHKVVAYKLVSQDVRENNNKSPASIKQSIKLPFQVDEDFCTDDGPGWEIQVFDNAGTGGELEEDNNLCILSIDMQDIKKFRNDDLTGSVRRIGAFSPSTPSPASRASAPRERASRERASRERDRASRERAPRGPAPGERAPREPTPFSHDPHDHPPSRNVSWPTASDEEPDAEFFNTGGDGRGKAWGEALKKLPLVSARL